VRIWDRGPAILNQHLFRVIPAPGIERDWLRWVLHVTRTDIRELMHGSTMTHITQPMMRDVRVPVPNLDTQREMARAANLIHQGSAGLLGALDQQAARLDERRRALITAAVTGLLQTSGVAA
jgi:type I restriction enzyme S subunit